MFLITANESRCFHSVRNFESRHGEKNEALFTLYNLLYLSF